MPERSLSGVIIYKIPKTAFIEVRKTAKIRKRYNQVQHLTQDTTWEINKKYNKHHQ